MCNVMDYVTDYIFVMSFGISNGLQVVSNLPSTACQIFFRTFYKETLHGKHDINRKLNETSDNTTE